MQTRIYVVNSLTDPGERHLVEAQSGPQAIRHVVSDKYNTHVASTKDVSELMSRGVTVKKAQAVDEH